MRARFWTAKRGGLSLRPWPLERRLLLAQRAVFFAVCVALGLVWLWILPSTRTVLSPWPAGEGEGLIIEGVQRWLAGNSLYPSPDQLYNSIDFPYPPLYAVALAGPLALGLPPFISARVISALALLITLASLVAIVRMLTQRWLPAVTAALALPATSQAAFLWSLVGRVDSLALAWSTVGLALWLAGKRWQQALALLCLSCALLTKETMAAAPAALVASALLTRRWRESAVVTLGVGVPTAAVYLLCNAVSNGAFAFDLVALGKVRPFFWLQWLGGLTAFMVFSGFISCIGWYFLWRQRAPLFLRVYSVFAAVVYLGTEGKVGSAAGYESELALTAAIGMGLMLHYVRSLDVQSLDRDPTAVRNCVHVAVVAVCATGLWLSWNLTHPGGWFVGADGPAHQAVEQALRQSPGPVLSDLPGDLVLSGHDEAVTDWFAFTMFTRAGVWSEKPVLDAIRNRQFSLIALDINPMDTSPEYFQVHYSGKMTTAMFAAMRSTYTLRETTGARDGVQYFILVPATQP